MPYKDPVKQREAQRRSEARTREIRNAKQRAKRKAIRDWVVSLKRDTPCADCGGVFHPAAMHWDHLPQYEKVGSIRELASRFPNRELVMAEIAKCELVCANCHAVRTCQRMADNGFDVFLDC